MYRLIKRQFICQKHYLDIDESLVTRSKGLECSGTTTYLLLVNTFTTCGGQNRAENKPQWIASWRF